MVRYRLAWPRTVIKSEACQTQSMETQGIVILGSNCNVLSLEEED